MTGLDKIAKASDVSTVKFLKISESDLTQYLVDIRAGKVPVTNEIKNLSNDAERTDCSSV